MRAVAACLLDVYETVLSCDFGDHATQLPALAGVPVEVWNRQFLQLGPAVTDGTLSMADAYAQVIRAAGKTPTADVVAGLVQRDHELLVQGSRVHDDRIPFLEMLRRRGIATAFVSNCAENTRLLLDELGLSGLVDVLILSCEVGWAKPSPEIYQNALGALGVSAQAAVLVDDQRLYCDGASLLGITAIQICRGNVGSVGHEGATVACSLWELEGLF